MLAKKLHLTDSRLLEKISILNKGNCAERLINENSDSAELF